jgi:CheY-like chemotaxis protein
MSKRVLIVDDEFEILFVLQRVFEDLAGWETVGATSSVEGLEKAATEAPDAIVLDVSLPEMDGFAFLDVLRSNPAIATIPVVLLTAKVTPSDRRRFEDLPISGVVAKPFDPMTVWREVAAVLGWMEG